MGETARIRSFLMMLVIIALTMLLIPILYVDMPYGAWEYDVFWVSMIRDEQPDSDELSTLLKSPLPFEILSVSLRNPTPGMIIFEITIRTRERILEIAVDPMLHNVTSETTYPHETYPQYGHDLSIGEEKTFGVIVEYAPEDADISVGYSIMFLRVVTIYRTVRRSIISLLPPFPYALLMGGVPILITLIAAELPIFQKIASKINVEFFLEIKTYVIGICMMLLLISIWLPWISDISLSKYFSFEIHDSDPFPSSQTVIVTVRAYALALLIGFVPIEIEISRTHIRRKILHLRSLISGALSIISASSWIYGVEITRIEPVHPTYVIYEANMGPFLAIIFGFILIFLSYLSTKMTWKYFGN